MKKHFVTFYSPGTLFSEETTREVDAWSIQLALKIKADIAERHGARPFGFRFTTRGRSENDLDSKVIASSPMYYIDGQVETYEDVVKRNDPKEEILRDNMRINDIARIVITHTPWRHTARLSPGDHVLNESGEVLHVEPKEGHPVVTPSSVSLWEHVRGD